MRRAALELLLASCSIVLAGTLSPSIAGAKTPQGYAFRPGPRHFVEIPKVRRLKTPGAQARVRAGGPSLVSRTRIPKSFLLSSSPRRSCGYSSEGAAASSRSEPHPFVEELGIEGFEWALLFEDARRFALGIRRVPRAVDQDVAWAEPGPPKIVDFERPSSARLMARIHPKMPPSSDAASIS